MVGRLGAPNRDREQRPASRERDPAGDQPPLDGHHALQRPVDGRCEIELAAWVNRLSALAQPRDQQQRQQQRYERRHADDLQPGRLQHPAQLPAVVAALVLGVVVERSPQPAVLRNGDEDAAARYDRLAHLLDDDLVLTYVLEHVERAHDGELGVERELAPVHLEALAARQPALCNPHVRVARVPRDNAEARKAPAHPGGHVARAAADLQQAGGVREMRLQRPGDERVARAEPEAPVLDVLEVVEGLLEQALVAAEARREAQIAVLLGREAADRALPRRPLEPRLAADARVHQAQTYSWASLKRSCAPPPSALAAETAPPWASATCRTIASPSPDPGKPRAERAR